MFKKSQAQSFLVIICIIIILVIVLFGGLGEYFGVAADSMCAEIHTGFAGWFFCNWITVIFFMFIIWVLWMMFHG